MVCRQSFNAHTCRNVSILMFRFCLKLGRVSESFDQLTVNKIVNEGLDVCVCVWGGGGSGIL